MDVSSPLSVGLVASSEVVKQPAVHLHKCLENIVYKRHNRLVPMLLTYPEDKTVLQCYIKATSLIKPVKRWEHDGHDDLVVFFNE